MKELKGIVTPMITPYKKGNIDDDALKSLMDFLHKNEINGIFPAGSTGASPVLSKKEHMKIIEEVNKLRKEKDYFMPGTGKNSIEDTIEISKFAIDLNADALVIVTPYYMKMDQESLLKYYKIILEKIDSKVLIYNIPQLTGNSINAETLEKLVNEYSNIIGIKDSSGDMTFFQDYILRLGKKIKIFQGQDELLLPSLVLGADGGVCATTNFTNLANHVFYNFNEGNLKLSLKYQKILSEIKNYLNERPFPQSYSYLFYKLIMNKDETGSPDPFRSLKKSEMDEILNKINSLIKTI